MLSVWIDLWLMNGYRNISVIPAEKVCNPEFAVVGGCYVFGDLRGRECIGWIFEEEFWWNVG